MLFANALVWQWSPRQAGGPPSAPRAFAGFASWFTTDGDRITHVGHGDIPLSVLDEHKAEVVDLDGQLVLPGLHDSHIHLYHMGEVAHYVDLRGAASFDDLHARVAAHAAKYPDVDWLVGFGWEQDKLASPARYPTRADLDAISSTRPIYLWRTCYHIATVNSAALAKAGLDIVPHPAWANVPGGVVDLDAQGLPTGILRESAVNLVQKYILEQSDDIRTKYLQIGLQTALEFGLTAVHTNDAHCLPLYRQLQAKGELPIRVYMTPDQHELEDATTGALGPPIKDELITVDRVKLFGDGSLGAETAALRAPYRDSTNTGVLMETDAEMARKIHVANAAGYRVEIHAIGDRAAAQVLDAMGRIKGIDRPIMTHCQILGPDLIAKMAALGVVANIQPSFVVTDATFASKRLPQALLPYSYCWQTMVGAGVVCAGGSDAPIETSNPFQGMYDAIHRAAPLDDPRECMTFTEALQLYTLNGGQRFSFVAAPCAFAAKEETRLGDLASGFQADFVVVKYNLLETPEKLLAPDLLQRVYVQGRLRYDSIDGPKQPLAMQAAGLPGKNGKIRICRCCRAA
ncbi:Aste57867_12361 [Aphanomyces stellatus]|uniref:Aste57867_12361 protein n=1 Tax=Aphanomyces stellatus TaxID=120398 RepID=A0A485KVE3_9STRA|nr:hypothetical protein As57867_012315 [Aphanomyces stellatus]VFT89213.1 Aste57867_12361 [Aphanomyces stellatus]